MPAPAYLAYLRHKNASTQIKADAVVQPPQPIQPLTPASSTPAGPAGPMSLNQGASQQQSLDAAAAQAQQQQQQQEQLKQQQEQQQEMAQLKAEHAEMKGQAEIQKQQSALAAEREKLLKEKAQMHADAADLRSSPTFISKHVDSIGKKIESLSKGMKVAAVALIKAGAINPLQQVEQNRALGRSVNNAGIDKMVATPMFGSNADAAAAASWGDQKARNMDIRAQQLQQQAVKTPAAAPAAAAPSTLGNPPAGAPAATGVKTTGGASFPLAGPSLPYVDQAPPAAPPQAAPPPANPIAQPVAPPSGSMPAPQAAPVQAPAAQAQPAPQIPAPQAPTGVAAPDRAAQLRAAYPGMEKTFPDRFQAWVAGNQPIPQRADVVRERDRAIAGHQMQGLQAQSRFDDSLAGKIHNGWESVINMPDDFMQQTYGDNMFGRAMGGMHNQLQDTARHGWLAPQDFRAGNYMRAGRHAMDTAAGIAPWLTPLMGLRGGVGSIVGNNMIGAGLNHGLPYVGNGIGHLDDYFNPHLDPYSPDRTTGAYRVGNEHVSPYESALRNARARAAALHAPGMSDPTNMMALNQHGYMHNDAFQQPAGYDMTQFQHPWLRAAAPFIPAIYPQVDMSPYSDRSGPDDMMTRLQALAPLLLAPRQ